jgi:tetratricopeptide (TPR) repeat protein
MLGKFIRTRGAFGRVTAGIVLLWLLAPNSPAAQSPDLIQQGAQAYYRGDMPGAVKLAKRHSALYPSRPEGWVLLARAQMAEGALEPAFKSLREALRRDPQNIDGLFYLGLVSAALAGGEFQDLMTMAPDSARAHQFLAESYVGEGNASKAVEEYQAALALQPRSVEILVALADVERSRSRYDEAVEYYTRAIEMDPNDYGSVYGLGLVLFRRGDYQKSQEYFRRAAALDPATAVPRMALGMALFHSGDAAGAIPELQSATTMDPKLRQAFTYLAQACHVAGRTAEARQALQKATALAAQESKSDERRVSGIPSEPDLPSAPSDAVGAAAPQK